MISVFKNNLFFNSLLLLPYLILLKIHSLIYPMAYTIHEYDSILTKGIFGFISNSLLQNILAIFIVYIQAIYINKLVIEHRLANKSSLLPGMIYIILMSFFSEYSLLSPYLIANTFVLLAIGQLFKTYNKPKVADILFNIGFYIGIASLFVPNYIYLMLLGVIGIFILRSGKISEHIQFFSGLLVVGFLVFGGMYLLDIPILIELKKINSLSQSSIFSVTGSSLYRLVAIVTLAVFVVFSYGTYTFKKNILTKKKIDVLFWILVLTAIMVFTQPNVEPSQVLLTFIPLSIFLHLNLQKIKSQTLQETIHFIIIITLFGFQFEWFGLI